MKLSEIIKSRSVEKVVYFHCDHFEPSALDGAGERIGAGHVAFWKDQLRQYDFSMHPSLFFLSHRYVVVPPGIACDEPFGVPGDEVRFRLGGQADSEDGVLREVADMDVHIHIHHERWTSNDLTGWPRDPEKDAERLDFHLKLVLDHFRKSGVPLDGWGFVHGCWSLNASDPSICNITNEIEVLQRNGCFGDFSFPPGRPRCNPTTFSVPSTVLPVNAVKGYDEPGAEPVPVGEGALQPGRFLIWATPLTVKYMSLENARNLPSEEVATFWLEQSPVIGNTLFIKTHCHSMAQRFWASATSTTAPILDPNTIKTFGLLEEACNEAGIGIDYLTLRETMTLLRQLDGTA